MAKITNTGVFIVEGASAAADVAGSSQIWTKSETPSALYHTDDAGNDHRLGITLKTKVDSTSGTVIEFTSIPSGVKRIILSMADVSTDGSSDYLVQLGRASTTYETSGYKSAIGVEGSAELSTAGFQLTTAIGAGETWSAQVTLCLLDSGTFQWVGQVTGGRGDGASASAGCGSKALSAELTAVRLTTVSADTFDAGDVNIQFQ